MKIHLGRDDITNFSSEEYLKINSANVNHSRGIPVLVLREEGRVDYHLLFVAKGQCTVTHNGTEHLLGAGEYVLYFPGERQKYFFPAGTDAVTLWLHFTGGGVASLLQSLAIRSGVFRAERAETIEKLLQKIIRYSFLNTPQYSVAADGYLLQLLSALSSGQGELPVLSGVVERALFAIRESDSVTPSVSALADDLGISAGRLSHLFKSQVGMGIKQYALKLKNEKAKELLEATDLPIGEVATLLGFNDPLYFSRSFKKQNGMSPKEYKQKNIKEYF
jgi:AraC-like DNA-binding protein